MQPMFRVGCRALRVPGHAAFSTTRRVANAGKPLSSIPQSIDNLLSVLGSPAVERARPPPAPSAPQPLKPQGAVELDADDSELMDPPPSPPEGPDPDSLSAPPTAADGTAKPLSTASSQISILPYTLHIHASRNNTMLTLTGPGGKVPKKGWVSSGVLRFRKANRSSYEAGYQCAAWMFRRIAEELYQLNKDPEEEDAAVPAWNASSKKGAKAAAAQAAAAARVPPKVLKANIELTLKFDGFGPGRDAVFRALLTQEGEPTARLVRWVSDCTPLKIGGTRAKKMRRL